MRVAAVKAGLVALVAVLSLPQAVSSSPALPALPIDVVEPCLEVTPAAIDVHGVTDDGRARRLDVLVLLDVAGARSVSRLLDDPDTAARGRARYARIRARADKLLRAARQSYDSHGVDAKLRYALLRRDGESSSDVYTLMGLAKRQVRGQVPRGVDIVYVASDKDLTLNGGRGVVGMADCIGGVRYRDRAFAVGQLYVPEAEGLPFPHLAAKILGHEVGHLLGGHHHYANCAEGVPTNPDTDPYSACTLMFNDISLASLNLSSVNATVIRGHAVDYLDQ